MSLRKPPTDRSASRTRSSVRAARILKDIDRERELWTIMLHLADITDDRAELAALSDLALSFGDRKLSLRIAKAASLRNIVLAEHAYPTAAMPNWTHKGPPVEKALVYGLSRQESEFDPDALEPGRPHAVSCSSCPVRRALSPGRSAFPICPAASPIPTTTRRSDRPSRRPRGERVQRLLHHEHRRLQRGPFSRTPVGDEIRRSALDRRRPHRLDREHPVLRNPQLCAARDGEHGSLSWTAERPGGRSPDRRGPAPLRGSGADHDTSSNAHARQHPLAPPSAAAPVVTPASAAPSPMSPPDDGVMAPVVEAEDR